MDVTTSASLVGMSGAGFRNQVFCAWSAFAGADYGRQNVGLEGALGRFLKPFRFS